MVQFIDIVIALYVIVHLRLVATMTMGNKDAFSKYRSAAASSSVGSFVYFAKSQFLLLFILLQWWAAMSFNQAFVW